MFINSYWQNKTGKWNGKKYIRKQKSKIEEKRLEVRLEIDKRHNEIIKFLGGPTGFEAYFLKDLLSNGLDHDEKFYICVGNINSWPSCYIKTKDLKYILEVLNCHESEDH